jgi:hypothetical protein
MDSPADGLQAKATVKRPRLAGHASQTGVKIE